MQKQANRMRSIGKGQCLSQDPAIETSEDFELSRLHLNDGEPLLWSRGWKIEVGVHIYFLITWYYGILQVWREDMIFPFIFKLQMRENDTGVVFKEVTIYKIILDTKFKSSQLSLLHMVNVWRIFDYQLLFASVD